MWLLWLIAAGVFFVAEIFTAGFLIFWLGVAALVSMIISFFISNVIIQGTVFVILSGILMFLTRPLVDRFITKPDDKVATNAYSIIGKRGIVIKEINEISGTGQIKVGTEVWSAKSNDNSPINIVSSKFALFIISFAFNIPIAIGKS